MSRLIIGIDPGNTGAICIIDGKEIENIVMPLVDGQVDEKALSELFLEIASEIKHVYLEEIFGLSKCSASSMLNFGRGHGKIVGILTAYKIPFTLVRPQVWQKEMLVKGIAGTTKERALKTVRKAYKHINFLATDRSKVPHAGIVDAVLIAHYGVNKNA